MSESTSLTPVVRILPADVEFRVEPGEVVVDAIRRHGYRTRYSCRRGGCGICKADLLTGTVSYCSPIAASVLSDSDRAAGQCLPCKAIPQEDITIRLSARDTLRDVFGRVSSSTKPVARGEQP